MMTRWVWPDRRTLGKDAGLWFALSFPVLVSLVADAAAWWRYPLELVVVAAGRVYPPAAFVLAGLATFLDSAFVVALPVASFRTGRLVPSMLPAAVILVGCGIAAPALGVGGPQWVEAMLLLLSCGVLPWLVGYSWRQYQVLMHAGWQRADQLEREQRMRAEQARLRERARIANDMHDSLGHELGLIALRAGALELDGDLGERHRTAVGDLRAGIGDVTERLREIVGVLRADDESASTVPGHATPADLVARAAASGMDVTLDENGTAGPLPPLVAHAVCRVVQESLTNAGRHAPGAATTVQLGYAPDATTVTVVNGRPTRRPAGRTGGGHGYSPCASACACSAVSSPRTRPLAGLSGSRHGCRMTSGWRSGGAADAGYHRVVASAGTGAAHVPPQPRSHVPRTLCARRAHGARGGRAVPVLGGHDDPGLSIVRPDGRRPDPSPDRVSAAAPRARRILVGNDAAGATRHHVRVLPSGHEPAEPTAALPVVLRTRPTGRQGRRPSRAEERMIRVLLADDEAMVRAGVRAILAADANVEVVAEACDGRDAVELVRRHRPDVALLDIRMPRLDGLAACAEIKRLVPDTAVVMLTTFSEDEYIARALGDGASGFLLKSGDPRELLACVRAAADGAAYLSPRVAQRVIAELGRGGGGRMARRAEGPQAGGDVERARARRARAARRRSVQRGDRPTPLPRRGDGEGVRQCRLRPA